MKGKILILLIALMVAQAPAMGEGRARDAVFQIYGQYDKVVPPQTTPYTKQVEVVELFWYGCPHCFSLEPHLNDWLKNKPDYVVFQRMPAVFNARWKLHAHAYYTAKHLGVLEKIHDALFHAIHRQRRPLNTKEQLMAFFNEHGVAEEDFRSVWKSFAVNNDVRRATIMTERYGIDGVPAVIVNGKYRTSGSMAGTYRNLIKVINILAEEEHRAMTASASASDDAS